MTTPLCFDCRFFVPEGRLHNDLTEDQWDDCLEGTCRAEPPSLGELLADRHGERFRHYGEWPKVMASDWCGRFAAARPTDDAPRSRTVAVLRLTEKGKKGV